MNNPTPRSASANESSSFWPHGWWKIMELRVGILPVPVYLMLFAIVAWFAVQPGKFPTEICMMMTVLAVGGFTCGELGKRLPVLHHFGAAAIFATFIPSYLAYKKILPEALITAVTDFTKGTNFLYLFIAAVIVGSILGMDRTVLIRGFVKIFVPMAPIRTWPTPRGQWLAAHPRTFRKRTSYLLTGLRGGPCVPCVARTN